MAPPSRRSSAGSWAGTRPGSPTSSCNRTPGVVYAAPNAKLVDHGSGSAEDTHVPLVVVDPGHHGGVTLSCPVSLRQVAPTILKALGLKPQALDAVRLEGTKTLPDDATCS